MGRAWKGGVGTKDKEVSGWGWEGGARAWGEGGSTERLLRSRTKAKIS